MLSALVEAVERQVLARSRTIGVTSMGVPGISLVRAHGVGGINHVPRRPLVCLVLQGAKEVIAGSAQARVQAGETSLMTATAPNAGHIVEASQTTPYLAIALNLDLELLTTTWLEMELAGARPPVSVGSTDDQVLATVLRLMQMLDRPASLPVLQAPLVREMHYWLLSGRHGPALRRLDLPCGHRKGVQRAIDLINTELDAALDIQRLADMACMGLSTFRRHFHAATALSPLQFQKRLRLREAKRLMLHDGLGPAPAAYAVGYRSVSQFTREYHRLFGLPPARDIGDTRRAFKA